MFTQDKQRETLKLKVGDKAYYLVDETYAIFDLVTITGDCEEGHGYSAISPYWAEHYPPKEEDDIAGAIHTCNNTLVKTKREARAEVVRILTKSRKQFVKDQSFACRSIQYIDRRLGRR